MATKVFENQTTNITSPEYLFEGGYLQVDIQGTLDGADVKTVLLNDDGTISPSEGIADLSWRASKSETLDTSDSGIRFLNKRRIQFILENAGASTNISLWFDNYNLGC